MRYDKTDQDRNGGAGREVRDEKMEGCVPINKRRWR